MEKVETFHDYFENYKEKKVGAIIDFLSGLNANTTKLTLSDQKTGKILWGFIIVKGENASKVASIVEAFMDKSFEDIDKKDQAVTEMGLEIEDYKKRIEELEEENKRLTEQRDELEMVATEWMNDFQNLKDRYEPDMIVEN